MPIRTLAALVNHIIDANKGIWYAKLDIKSMFHSILPSEGYLAPVFAAKTALGKIVHYQCLRLAFGAAEAPALATSILDPLVATLKDMATEDQLAVNCHIDDIFIASSCPILTTQAANTAYQWLLDHDFIPSEHKCILKAQSHMTCLGKDWGPQGASHSPANLAVILHQLLQDTTPLRCSTGYSVENLANHLGRLVWAQSHHGFGLVFLGLAYQQQLRDLPLFTNPLKGLFHCLALSALRSNTLDFIKVEDQQLPSIPNTLPAAMYTDAAAATGLGGFFIPNHFISSYVLPAQHKQQQAAERCCC